MPFVIQQWNKSLACRGDQATNTFLLILLLCLLSLHIFTFNNLNRLISYIFINTFIANVNFKRLETAILIFFSFIHGVKNI